MKKVLIIGGTSGLGRSLAEKLSSAGYKVAVTGRIYKSKDTSLLFYKLDLASEALHQEIESIVKELGQIDLFIYAAGFCQWATTAKLAKEDIDLMISTGLTAPIYTLQTILKNQDKLEFFVPITSTSEWTPREYEPVYTAVKSGLGMYAKSVALDAVVEKVLVAGPAGMKTAFWDNTDMDTSTMLEPDWVADQIIEQMQDSYSFRHVRILREPPRLQVDESR